MNRTFRRKDFYRVIKIVLLAFFLLPVHATARSETVVVFAAASTTDVITAVTRLFMGAHPETVTSSFAASSTLAKQIEAGAPADIFISADLKWMDYLAEKKCIDIGTRRNLLGNRMVLIAPADSRLDDLQLFAGCDLEGVLNGGRLAMGDPEHVPAGRYGRAALEHLGIWGSVERQIAPAATVRAALALVERKEAPLGIVYATDATVSERIKVVGRFPENERYSVVYPAAIMIGRKTPAVQKFTHFLGSKASRTVFEEAGFRVY